MGRSCVAVDLARTFKPVRIAVLTVSDSRTLETDTSGGLLVERLEAAGHFLAERALVPDVVPAIVAKLSIWIADPAIDCVITTGGTGMTGRDITPEALEQVRAEHGGKDVPGFGELFRWVSFQTIGTSTMQSRACAIVAGGTWIFALPGSNGAVKDGWDGILAEQLDSRNRPCNVVELLPRLREA
jgi:molybdenum cofactor biosynthesis protein B